MDLNVLKLDKFIKDRTKEVTSIEDDKAKDLGPLEKRIHTAYKNGYLCAMQDMHVLVNNLLHNAHDNRKPNI